MLSFGTGFHLIDRGTLVADFGLRTAANLVDPKRPSGLRCLDMACLSRRAAQIREQATQASRLDDFGIDTATDLLRALTIHPLDTRFGVRVHGNNSLKVAVKSELGELAPLLSELLSTYHSEAYRQGPLAFIDHIRPVKDNARTEALDEHLLADSDHDHIHIAPPTIIDWERVSGFRYRQSQRAAVQVELQLTDLLSQLGKRPLTIERLKRQRIWCVDDVHEVVTHFTAWKGLQAEIDHDGQHYVLFDGSWFRIDQDFVSQIEQFMATLDRHGQPLPEYNDDIEGDYNQRAVLESGGALELLDRRCIRVPGAASPVEPCDLLRDGQVFMHFKRGTDSRSLSHLFSQGVVSAEMLLNSTDYRTRLKSVAGSIRGIDDPGAAPDPRQYEVVYAIVDHTTRSSLVLPFFSKVSLRVAVQRLKGMGFKVSLLRIGVAPERRLLSRYSANRAS